MKKRRIITDSYYRLSE